MLKNNKPQLKFLGMRIFENLTVTIYIALAPKLSEWFLFLFRHEQPQRTADRIHNTLRAIVL